MRFMMLVKATPEYEAGAPPRPEVIAEVSKLAEEMTRSGALISSGGLLPSREAQRVVMRGGRSTVTDGPFAETKELIGGYAVVEASSKSEALELARQFLDAHVRAGMLDLEMEIRPMFDGARCGEMQPA
jgi:hypothetical protein